MSRLRRTSSAGLLCWFVIAWIASAQPQRPNVKAQAEAMKKLAFLVGTWTGDAATVRSNQKVKVRQTEEVSYKLDGLVLLIEGTGRNPESGEVTFRSLATISYDDGAGVYHFRAYHDGSYLDTDLKVPDRGFEWGYKAGSAQIAFAMKLNNTGDWVETGDVTVGNTPVQRFFDMTVRKQK
jgi:hypothetical protein